MNKCAECRDFVIVRKSTPLGIGSGIGLIGGGIALGAMIAVLIPCGLVAAAAGALCIFVIKKPVPVCLVCATPRQTV
jgi:hypothetical protein